MIHPSLFEDAVAAPATSPRQTPRERISPDYCPSDRVETERGVSTLANLPVSPDNGADFITQRRIVVQDGREYRLHRDCGEFVWLAALDAGIAGPFYWVRASDVTLALISAPLVDDSTSERKQAVRAAQARLAACAPAEYDDRLHDLHAAMKEGRG